MEDTLASERAASARTAEQLRGQLEDTNDRLERANARANELEERCREVENKLDEGAKEKVISRQNQALARHEATIELLRQQVADMAKVMTEDAEKAAETKRTLQRDVSDVNRQLYLERMNSNKLQARPSASVCFAAP